MKLNRKIRVFTVVFTLLTLFIVSAIIDYFGTNNYYEVESLFFNRTKEISAKVVRDVYDDLNVLLNDWAKWTNTYNFVKNNNDNYVDNNLTISTYEDLGLNYVLILNEDMDVKYAAHYDETSIVAVDEEVIAELKSSKFKTGILRINGDFVLVTSQAITDSEATLNGVGMFLFGKILDDEDLAEFKRDLGYDIDLSVAEMQKYYYEYNYGIISELEHYKKADSYFEIILPILNEKNSIYMKITLDNEIQELGDKYKNNYLILAVIILISFGVVLDQMFRFLVVKRILKVNNEINMIISEDNISSRVSVENGNDEISQVSENINKMLDRIENMNKELYHNATYDKMTSAYNRNSGIKKLNLDIEKSKKTDMDLSIIYIDIDNLKTINDTYGHKIGDKLIIDTIKVVKKVLKDDDYIIRLGGDEFLIVLKYSTLDYTRVIVEDIEKSAKDFNNLVEDVYNIEMSIGIAEYSDNLSTEEFIDKADEDMYKDKKDKKSKNKFRL